MEELAILEVSSPPQLKYKKTTEFPVDGDRSITQTHLTFTSLTLLIPSPQCRNFHRFLPPLTGKVSMMDEVLTPPVTDDTGQQASVITQSQGSPETLVPKPQGNPRGEGSHSNPQTLAPKPQGSPRGEGSNPNNQNTSAPKEPEEHQMEWKEVQGKRREVGWENRDFQPSPSHFQFQNACQQRNHLPLEFRR